VQVDLFVVFPVAIVMTQHRHLGGESLDPDAATVVVAASDVVVVAH
jgi:hypothetical protein